MHRLLGLVLATATAMALLALTAGQAGAQTVHCGDFITQDTTLDADLNCPAAGRDGFGLYLNGATLDLGGHTISGPGHCGDCHSVGVLGGPTLRNGTVRGWDTGVDGGGQISNMTITDTKSPLRGNYRAVIGNTLRDNFFGMSIVGDFNFSETLIKDNSVSDTHEQNYSGIAVLATRGPTVVEGNSVFDNGGGGIEIHGHLGEDANATIRNNRIDHNAADGIHVDARLFYFYTEARYKSLRFEDNEIDHNGDDGIDVEDCRDLMYGVCDTRGASAVNNHLWWNGDLGIEALPGASGGGNWAKHNGNPAQCVPGSLCSTTGKPKN